MKRLFILILAAIIAIGMLQAQNPIIRDQFTADPTARVFDGKLYIYPSHDIHSPVDHLKKWFCMEDYHVFSSTNLTDWIELFSYIDLLNYMLKYKIPQIVTLTPFRVLGHRHYTKKKLLQYLDIVGVVHLLSISVQRFCDPPGARTQDPNIKSVVLYLLS